jgi:hypothetical protein
MVKVSGYVPDEVHGDMAQLAARFHSTVTALASYAMQSAVKELKKLDKAPKGLELDQRRDRAKNGED